MQTCKQYFKMDLKQKKRDTDKTIEDKLFSLVFLAGVFKLQQRTQSLHPLCLHRHTRIDPAEMKGKFNCPC